MVFSAVWYGVEGLDADVVEQHIQAAESLNGLTHHALTFSRSRHVGNHEMRLRTQRFDRLDCLPALARVDIGHRHQSTLACERERTRAPDAKRATCDDNYLVVKSPHRVPAPSRAI